MERFFRTVAIISHSDRDGYNYPRTNYEYEKLEADSLPDLYEKMACFKLSTDRENKNFHQRTTVSFELIEEITVHADHYFDEKILYITPSYVAHIAKAEAAIQAEEAKKAQMDALKAEQTKEQEIAMLLELQKKYPGV